MIFTKDSNTYKIYGGYGGDNTAYGGNDNNLGSTGNTLVVMI